MSEERSKCCGHEVNEELDEFYDEEFGEKISDEIIFICSGCGMRTEVKEKGRSSNENGGLSPD